MTTATAAERTLSCRRRRPESATTSSPSPRARAGSARPGSRSPSRMRWRSPGARRCCSTAISGLANVDVQLGCTPRRDLASVLAGEIDARAGRDGESLRLRHHRRAFRLRQRSRAWPASRLLTCAPSSARFAQNYDWVVLDLGAGIERTVRLLAGRRAPVSSSPPTSRRRSPMPMPIIKIDRARAAGRRHPDRRQHGAEPARRRAHLWHPAARLPRIPQDRAAARRHHPARRSCEGEHPPPGRAPHPPSQQRRRRATSSRSRAGSTRRWASRRRRHDRPARHRPDAGSNRAGDGTGRCGAGGRAFDGAAGAAAVATFAATVVGRSPEGVVAPAQRLWHARRSRPGAALPDGARVELRVRAATRPASPIVSVDTGGADEDAPPMQVDLGTTIAATCSRRARDAGDVAAGTRLLLRILAPFLAADPEALAGQVVASGGAETVVETPIGTLALDRQLALPPGTAIALTRLGAAPERPQCRCPAIPGRRLAVARSGLGGTRQGGARPGPQLRAARHRARRRRSPAHSFFSWARSIAEPGPARRWESADGCRRGRAAPAPGR